MKGLLLLVLSFLVLVSCRNEVSSLPVLTDPHDNSSRTPIQIPSFSFTDQNYQTVTEKTFEGKIYVADFIFLSCPTICPKMNMEMLKVYKAFENDQRVLFLSHTIDPENDSIPRLQAFAKNLGVSNHKWHFVTGNVDSIYRLAEKSYFTTVYPDSADAKNFIHGGGLLLVDKDRHIRGVYDGTSEAETEKLIKDIKLLLGNEF